MWRVNLYQEEDGSVPLMDWLDGLDAKVQDKCIDKIERLTEYGNKLRRPNCDYLEEGIWELRLQHLNVQYRILYFYHKKKTIVLLQGLVKKRKIPRKELKRAIENRNKYIHDPQKHTYQE